MIPRLRLLIVAVAVPAGVAVNLGGWALRIPLAGLRSNGPLLLLSHRAISLVSLHAVLGLDSGRGRPVRAPRAAVHVDPSNHGSGAALPGVLSVSLALAFPRTNLRRASFIVSYPVSRQRALLLPLLVEGGSSSFLSMGKLQYL